MCGISHIFCANNPFRFYYYCLIDPKKNRYWLCRCAGETPFTQSTNFGANDILREIMYYIGGTLLLAAAFACGLHVEASAEKKFNIVPSFRSGNAPIKSGLTKSTEECADWCTTEPLCLGFNYRSSDGQCDLLSTPQAMTRQKGWDSGISIHKVDTGEF